jgi:hypothetical protein
MLTGTTTTRLLPALVMRASSSRSAAAMSRAALSFSVEGDEEPAHGVDEADAGVRGEGALEGNLHQRAREDDDRVTGDGGQSCWAAVAGGERPDEQECAHEYDPDPA